MRTLGEISNLDEFTLAMIFAIFPKKAIPKMTFFVKI